MSRHDITGGTDTNATLVSVILPTYNRAHLISRAIGSVLHQNHRQLELIVVDDASTDETVDVVQGFDDPRLRYVRHTENRGAAAARNTAITASLGEYVAFIDADDEYLPTKLERQLEAFGQLDSRFGLVYCQGYRILPDGTAELIPRRQLRPVSGNVYEHLLERGFVDTVAPLVRRECLDSVGLFDVRLPRAEDKELWLRVAKEYAFHYLKQPLYRAYLQSDSLSFDEEARLISNRVMLEKHGEEMRQYPSVLARRLHTLGNLLCQKGELQEGRRYLLRAVKTDPPGMKSLLVLLASYAGPRAYRTLVRAKRRAAGQRLTLCE